MLFTSASKGDNRTWPSYPSVHRVHVPLCQCIKQVTTNMQYLYLSIFHLPIFFHISTTWDTDY